MLGENGESGKARTDEAIVDGESGGGGGEDAEVEQSEEQRAELGDAVGDERDKQWRDGARRHVVYLVKVSHFLVRLGYVLVLSVFCSFLLERDFLRERERDGGGVCGEGGGE